MSYLAPALAAEGAEVVVLTAEPPRGSGPIGEESVEVVRLPTSKLRFVGTILYMRNLRRWLDRNRVDVAYVSMLKHDAFVAIDAGRRLGFPVVLRPEGAGATGDLAWQSWGRFGRAIGRRCREAEAIVAISPAIRHELLAFGYDPGRIYDLPNGVPIPDPPWHPRPDWNSSPRAVFVGRLAPEKGLDTLVNAWPSVLSQHPSAVLTLVGEGPGRPGLEALRDRLKLDGSVRLPGSSADPGPSLRDSDLFVLPSLEEGMSIALLEAMAMGLPAVASAIPGNLGLMDDGVHGRLFTSGDPSSLSRAILDQWADPDRASAMAASARRRVVGNYSIAAVARRHLDLFGRLTREARGRESASRAACP